MTSIHFVALPVARTFQTPHCIAGVVAATRQPVVHAADSCHRSLATKPVTTALTRFMQCTSVRSHWSNGALHVSDTEFNTEPLATKVADPPPSRLIASTAPYSIISCAMCGKEAPAAYDWPCHTYTHRSHAVAQQCILLLRS